MRMKKVLAMLLTAAMLASLVVVPAAAEETVPGNWYDEAVSVWENYGIIKGDDNGNLNPEKEITRGEFAVILDRLMDYQLTAKNTFTDVKADQWYAEAILAANAAGIVKGDGTTARPLDNITRQEAAVMFARVLNLSGEAGASAGYTDEAEIANWAMDAVKSMTTKGYLKGSDGTFRPLDSITRAETVTILNNVFKAYYKEAGTYTGTKATPVAGSAVVSADKVVLKDMKIEGDLILAEGIGKGNVTLDGVTVGGQLIVRGGGENSIIIKGSSNIANVVVARQDGKVRVSVEGNAKVDVITVADGSDAVKVEGTVNTVTVAGAGAAVEITGTVKNLDVAQAAKGAALTVAKTAKVTNLTTAAEGTALTVAGTVTTVKVADTAADTKLDVAKGAAVSTVETAGNGTAITGNGSVKNVKVTAGEGTTIKTPGTKVDVDKGAGGVTTDKGEVKPGNSGTTGGTNPGTSTGGGSSGGSSTPTTYGISISATGGAVTSDSKLTGYASDENVTITLKVAPNEGYVLTAFTVDGVDQKADVADGSINVTVNGANVNVVATFMQPVSNAKIEFVTDEASYNSITSKTICSDGEAYNVKYPYEAGFDTGFPWAVVTYDQGVEGQVAVSMTKGGTDITFANFAGSTADGGKTDMLASKEAANGRWVMYELAKDMQVADTAFSGTYAVTLKLEGVTAAATSLYKHEGETLAEEKTVTFDVDGTTTTQKVLSGEAVGAPKAPVKAGYTFKHWSITADAEGSAYVFTTPVSSDLTLYAKFIVDTYNITYTLDNGTNDNENPANYTVATETITLKAATRTGYTFGGWYKDANFTNKVTTIAKGSTGAITLHAQWTADTYAITYNLNGGTNHADNTATYAYGTGLTLVAPTKANSEFLGWYSEATFETKVTAITGTETGAKMFHALWADPASGTLLGDEPEQIPGYTYATAYTAAGVTYANNVVTVDGEKLAGVVSAPTGDAYLTMENAGNAGKLWAGLTYAAPADAVTYEIVWAKVDGTDATNQITALWSKSENRAVRDSKTAVDFIPVWTGTATPVVADAGQIAYVKWENAEDKTLGVSMIKTEVAFTHTLETVALGADTLLLDSTNLGTLATDTAFAGIESHASYLNILKTDSGKYWLFGDYTALTGVVPGFGTVGTTEDLTNKCIILPFHFTAADLDASDAVNALEADDIALKAKIGTDERTYKKSVLESGPSWTRLLQFNMENAATGLTFEIQWAPDAGPSGNYVVSFGELTATNP